MAQDYDDSSSDEAVSTSASFEVFESGENLDPQLSLVTQSSAAVTVTPSAAPREYLYRVAGPRPKTPELFYALNYSATGVKKDVTHAIQFKLH
ncbi:uncharacterized protein LOC142343013 isoform X2 [Convolutriloba macropyga]|uniref:uncharacterized protein LOC142343013 isoform X2 n=1 Tax=Convolutriloba macropyga TaxID=536237 RepID=UPI003F5271A3